MSQERNALLNDLRKAINEYDYEKIPVIHEKIIQEIANETIMKVLTPIQENEIPDFIAAFEIIAKAMRDAVPDAGKLADRLEAITTVRAAMIKTKQKAESNERR